MDLRPDPVLERIRRSLATTLAGVDVGAAAGVVAAALRSAEAAALEAPIEAGGFELGVGCGVGVARELGRRALPDVYGPVALVLDALRSAGLAEGDTAAGLVAGTATVVLGGVDCAVVSAREPHGGRVRTGSGESDANRDGVLSGTPAGESDRGWVLSGTAVVEERGDQPGAWCAVGIAAEDEVLLALIPASVWRPRARPVPASVPDPVLASGANPALCSVDLEGVAIGGPTAGAEVIGSFGEGTPWSDPAGLLARARIRLAAYLSGLAEGAQAAALHYAARRLQFGRPLLDNQALSFPLAQAHIELTALDLRIRHAARLADQSIGNDPQAVALAAVESLAMAQETAATTVRLAMQIHGARALTAAEPVHAFHLALRSFGTVLGSRSPLWREAGLRRLTTASGPVEIGSAGAAAVG